jgi:hypothetical protein
MAEKDKRGGQAVNGPSLEVIQLQCVVEAKDCELLTLQEHIATLQVLFQTLSCRIEPLCNLTH